MAGKEVQFDIVAKDKASDKLDEVADKAEHLEKLDPVVNVKADTGAADKSVDAFADQLDKLTDADKLVVLALRAGNLQSELADISTRLATIDAADPNVAVTVDQYQQTVSQLDDIEQKMTDIAATSVDPDVGNVAKAKLDGLAESAGKTQGAVHSMAGNAVGDFAATATGIGPLGEALGQLTESITEGGASLKEMATAGLGLGAIAGAMALVQLAMDSFARAAKKAAEIKAFNVNDVDAYTKALKEGRDVTDDYIDRMTELGAISAVTVPDLGTKFDAAFTGIRDITAQLAAAQINVKDFAAGVHGTAADLDRFIAAIQATSLSITDQSLIISAARSEYDNFATATANAARFKDVFGEQAKQVDLFNKATQEMRNKLVGAATATNKLVDQMGDLESNTNDVTTAYQHMSDAISNDQSLIDLANQFDAVKQAGTDAMNAQAEANKAAAAGARDAADKQAAATQAMRDYETEVNNAKQAIIQMGETAGATPVQVKTALQKIDAGDLAGAKADAEAWSRRNPVEIQTELNFTEGLRRLKASLSGLSVGGTATAATVVNVSQVLPRGWHGDALGEAQSAARRSGGMFQRARR